MPRRRTCPPPATGGAPRWDAERQTVFLRWLLFTGSPTAAADAAGLSRESAYRCRAREAGGLFDLLWADIASRPPSARPRPSRACHTGVNFAVTRKGPSLPSAAGGSPDHGQTGGTRQPS